MGDTSEDRQSRAMVKLGAFIVCVVAALAGGAVYLTGFAFGVW